MAEVCRDQEGVDKDYNRLNYIRLNYMQKKEGNNSFALSKKSDIHETFNEDILIRTVLLNLSTARATWA